VNNHQEVPANPEALDVFGDLGDLKSQPVRPSRLIKPYPQI